MNHPHFPGGPGSGAAEPEQRSPYQRRVLAKARQKRFWKPISVILIGLAVILAFLFIYEHIKGTATEAIGGKSGASTAVKDDSQGGDEPPGQDQGDGQPVQKEDSCNVMVLPIDGSLITMPEMNDMGEKDGQQTLSGNIVGYLDQAEKDPAIKGIILWVNSYGGSPVAADEINKAVRRSSKPVVAVVRTAAASGGYLAISSTKRIFVSEFSDLGSIGVSSSYLDQSRKDAQEGLAYVELVSGQFKDAGNIHRPMTAAEKAMAKSDLDKIRQIFIRTVAKDRNLPETAVAKLADGRTFLGSDAIRLGLADELGDIEWARRYLAKQLDISVDDCMVGE